MALLERPNPHQSPSELTHHNGTPVISQHTQRVLPNTIDADVSGWQLALWEARGAQMKDILDRYDYAVDKDEDKLSRALSNRNQRWRQQEGGLGVVDKRSRSSSAPYQDEAVIKRLSPLQILHNIVWEIDLESMRMFQPQSKSTADDKNDASHRTTYPLPERKEPSTRMKKALRGCRPPKEVPTLAQYDQLFAQAKQASGIEEDASDGLIPPKRKIREFEDEYTSLSTVGDFRPFYSWLVSTNVVQRPQKLSRKDSA